MPWRRPRVNAGAGTLLLETFGSERYEEGKMRARGVGMMLDEMARSVRQGDDQAARTMREEIETALEDFAGT